MAKVHNFQVAKARQAAREDLRAAEAELADAQSLAENNPGLGVSMALVRRVSIAEKRVERARAALRAIDPTSRE